MRAVQKGCLPRQARGVQTGAPAPLGVSPSATLMAADHWRYNCTCARTDRGAYRSANKSARQSAGSAARQFLLRQSAARGQRSARAAAMTIGSVFTRISP